MPRHLSELIGTKCEGIKIEPKGLQWENLNDEVAMDNAQDLLQNKKDLDEIVQVLQEGSLSNGLKIAFFEHILACDPSEEILSKALHQPLLDREMIGYLRRMDFKTAQVLISKILLLISSVNHGDELFFETLLSWLESVLDAQYANFVVSKDPISMELLAKSTEIISNLDSSVNLLATTLPHMQMLKKKMTLDRNASINRMYAVEVVYL